MKRDQQADKVPSFADGELDQVSFQHNCIYEHKSAMFNYNKTPSRLMENGPQ